MQARTYQYFKKKGRIFSFPRFNLPIGENAVLVKNYLEGVIDLMKDSIRTQNYMILSPDTLHSYLNSYIEVLLNAEDRWNSDHYQDVLRLYSEIYRIFKSRSSIILDEIDMTMDPRKELNFPTQETEPYNMIAAALLADIMEFLVFDEGVRVTGLDIHGNNQASLTPENYIRCRDLLLDYIAKQLGKKESIWGKLIFAGKQDQITAQLTIDIMDFLKNSDMKHKDDWITDVHKNVDQAIANSLIIIKSQLYQYMEDSLKGTVNQNFGTAGNLRPEIKYAVPYVAANTPSPASVFADRWETLLKTLLMVSASPCSLNIAKQVIVYAKTSIMNESAGSSSFESTTTFNNLKLILPPKINPILLDEKNDLQVGIVQKALAIRSPAAIRVLFSFYINQVFSEMTFPIEQITSNALHMTSMFGSVQGYSGTIDNVNILPQCVISDAYVDHEKNEKNNGGISLKLVRDCSDAIVPELHSDSFNKAVVEMVKDVLGLYGKDVISHVSAIIDTGAFFKNFKNRQVAEAVLTVSGDKFEAGLYYDEDSNQLEFVRKSGSSFTRGFLDTTDPDDITKATQADLSKRFTFYDQRHITGSDILQPKTAHALMTAGPRVLLRDILQGTLRMRQFMTSQKVHFDTTEASRKFYNNKIKEAHGAVKVSDILALGALNENEKQTTENGKLAFAKIGVEVRGFVLDEISRILTGSAGISGKKDEVVNLFNCAKVIFLRLINEQPLCWLQSKELKGTAETLKTYAISLLRPLELLITNKSSDQYKRYNSTKKRIKNMIDESNNSKNDSLLRYLEDKINTRIESENGNEVQMQTMIDLNMDQLIDEICALDPKDDHKYGILPDLLKTKGNQDLEAENDHYVSFNHLFANQKAKNNNKDHIPLLDAALMTKGKRIGISRDLIELLEVNPGANKYPIFSKYTLEGSHLLVQEHNQNVKIVLVSSKHAKTLVSEIENYFGANFWLCDLSGTVSATNNPVKNYGQNLLEFIPEAQYLLFDILIFNGSLQQILKNPILRDIYEKEWLAAGNFKERAIFLLLRMKILFKKDSIMFEEDDEDLSKLKKYAMGEKNPMQKGNVTEGYPKAKVDDAFESDVRSRFKLNLSFEAFTEKPKTNNFDLYAEIMKLFQITKSRTSHVKPQSPITDLNKLQGSLADDLDYHANPDTPIVITNQALMVINPHADDKAVLILKSPSKGSSKNSSAPLDTEIHIENIKDYEEPDLIPIDDIFSKTIKVDTSSFVDANDVHDPDIKIEQLLLIDDIDSYKKPKVDEDIHVGLPKPKPKTEPKTEPKPKPEVYHEDLHENHQNHGLIIVIFVISIIAILAAVVGYLNYRRQQHVKVNKIEDDESKSTEKEKDFDVENNNVS